MYTDVPLTALRAALLEAQDVLVGAFLSCDVRTAVAMLDARTARRIPCAGLSFYRILLQRDVTDVEAGSASTVVPP